MSGDSGDGSRVSGDALTNRRVSGLQERFAEIGPLTSMERPSPSAGARARIASRPSRVVTVWAVKAVGRTASS